MALTAAFDAPKFIDAAMSASDLLLPFIDKATEELEGLSAEERTEVRHCLRYVALGGVEDWAAKAILEKLIEEA